MSSFENPAEVGIAGPDQVFVPSALDQKGFEIDQCLTTATPAEDPFEPLEHWVTDKEAAQVPHHRASVAKAGLELVHLTLADIPAKIKQKFVDIYRWDGSFADSQLLILLDEYNEMIDVVKSGDANARDESDDAQLWADGPPADGCASDEESPVYEVLLHSKTLGMTIENVMERTIVRNINPSSEAAKLGIQTNSLLLQVGHTKTIDNTHIETLDLLKNSARPVKLRLRRLDPETVNQRRAQMQALVQRQKVKEEVGRSLDWLEERLLWSLRMVAFTEGMRVLHTLGEEEKYTSNDPAYADVEIPEDVEDEIQSHFSFLLLSERTIAENARREVVINVRMGTISELLDKLRVGLGFKDCPSILIIERDLREICFSLLLLRTDMFMQAPSPLDIDHRTIYTLKQLLLHCVPNSTLRYQAIPMMWRLAASTSVSGRMACSIYISILYPRLPPHQKLQLRGLINRLSVDEFAMIRGHVLGVTCPKIMSMLDSAGLNWLAHCVTHSSSDEDETVRMQALTACTKLIQFYATSSHFRQLDMDVENFPFLPAFVPKSFYFADEQSLYDSDSEESSPRGKEKKVALRSVEEAKESSRVAVVTHSDTHLLYCRMLPMIMFLSEDESSDVRAYIASCVGLLCRYMGRPWSQAIVDILFSYFRDPNESVRAASMRSVPSTARAVLVDALASVSEEKRGERVGDAEEIPIDAAASSVKLLESFIPAVTGLHRDPSVLVRSTLAAMLPRLLAYLWPPLGTRDFMAGRGGDRSPRSCPAASLCPRYTQQLVETVAPVVLKLLGDSTRAVAAQMLASLSESSPGESEWSTLMFSGERTTEMLRCLSPLASHHLWRSRHAVCILLPCLASACNSVESRAKVAAIAVPLVTDDVFEVSRTAARALCLAGRCDLLTVSSDAVTDEGEPVQDMGRMWLDGIVLPQLHKMHHSAKSSVRIMALHMIAVIVLEEVIEKSDDRFVMLLDMALSLSTDKIPNVRLALAKVLKSLTPMAMEFKGGQEMGKIHQVLTVLATDVDKDVAYIGYSGLVLCKKDTTPPTADLAAMTLSAEAKESMNRLRILEKAQGFVQAETVSDSPDPDSVVV